MRWQTRRILPHALADETDAAENPIVICWPGAGSDITDVYMNLTNTQPDGCDRYDRILELVGAETTNKQMARQRYKQYRDLGFELHSHNLDQSHG